MQKCEKITSLFELLCLNDSKQINKFLIEHGKSPKAFCPIMFEERTELKEKDGEKDGSL